MGMVRIFYKADNTIIIMVPGKDRDINDCAKKAGYDHLPYDDMEQDDLPKGKGIGAKLRGEKGKGIWVDNTLETKREIFEKLNADLDIELDSPRPDPIKAMKLQRDIERLKKEKWQTRKKA